MIVKVQVIITSLRSIDYDEIVDYTDFTHYANEVEPHRKELAWRAFIKWCGSNSVNPNDFDYYMGKQL